MAVIVLIDSKTGFPLAIMSGKTIINMRTGAAGGIAAKYLARRDSRVLALVGAGAHARTQLEVLLEILKSFDEVRIWSRSERSKEEFKREMEVKYGRLCHIIPVKSIEDAVKGADIVMTLTPSREPIVMNDWVSEGMHFKCIGADASGETGVRSTDSQEI